MALSVMAILALMSWRALDGMQRVQTHTRVRSDHLLTLQASLAQWGADLDALTETGIVPALSFDGRTLRLTRRDPLEAHQPGMGLQVVAWANHQGHWMRWMQGDLRQRATLLQAWEEAARWGQTPLEADVPRQTALIPIQGWQIFYYRRDAWTHPLSADDGATTQAAATGGNAGTSGNAAAGAVINPELMALPEGVRLILDVSRDQPISGSLVKDWARPVLGGGKS